MKVFADTIPEFQDASGGISAVLLLSQRASLLSQQRHVVWISGAAGGFDVLQKTSALLIRLMKD